MRKTIEIILFCLCTCLTLLSQNNITFAFTSKYQSQFEPFVEDSAEYGGAARLAHVTRSLRLSSDRFIMLDTGDHFAGRFYRQNRGVPEVEMMNDIRYDALLVGSSELSMGEDIFDDWAKFARFPLVISNLIAPPQCKICRHIVSYTIIDRVGLTVGVFGLLPGDLEVYGRLPDAIGIDTSYVDVAREIVDILSEKSDIIVMLSQLDIENNEKLAEEVCEIDLIFVNEWAGYSDEPMIIENEAGCITIIGYAGSRGKKLGVVQTTWDDYGGMADFTWQPVTLRDSIPIDPEVHAVVESYFRPEEQLSVGISSVELDGRRAVNTSAESNLGNLVADAARMAFPDVDMALIPGGSIFGDAILDAGNITTRQIRELLPFGERVVLLEIEGELVERTLERSACNIENSFGGFMQISGASLQIDTSRNAQCIDRITGEIEEEGSRIREVRIDGEKLEKNKVYKVATTDFAASGGFGYFWLADKPSIVGRELSEIVIEYIGANSPVSPEFEGRIIVEP